MKSDGERIIFLVHSNLEVTNCDLKITSFPSLRPFPGKEAGEFMVLFLRSVELSGSNKVLEGP